MLCLFLLYSKVNQPHIYLPPPLLDFFPFRSPQSIKQNSLYCYTVGSH